MEAMTTTTNTRRPMTGEEYLESLRDGREVWLYGERIRDVTTHPAFRNAARSVARLYDALWDPANRGTISVPTDTGNGGFTHAFFRPPRSVEDMLVDQSAIAEWSRLGYGFLGRTPDYKACLFGGLDLNADFYAPYEENARRWHVKMQEEVLYSNHAIVNPPVDRSRPPDEVTDVYVHVEDETDEGLIVSGAKVVATNCALTHLSFVGYMGMPLKKKEFALCCFVDTGSPGVKMIARTSYELHAATIGSPFDFPLSSRFDENDCIFIMDRVLVPWENVLVYGDPEKATRWGDPFSPSGFMQRAAFHGATRLAVKLDFIAGLMLKAVAINGTDSFRSVQAHVGEVIAWRNLFWGLSTAMARDPYPWKDGALRPNFESAVAYRVFGSTCIPQVKWLVETSISSALIYLNGHAVDFKTPELRPLLDRYLRGSNGHDAVERVKTMKLLWETIGTEFGARHELYEGAYSGTAEDVRVRSMFNMEGHGVNDRLRGFAEQCMEEYDLDGWRVPDLFNPDDQSLLSRGG